MVAAQGLKWTSVHSGGALKRRLELVVSDEEFDMRQEIIGEDASYFRAIEELAPGTKLKLEGLRGGLQYVEVFAPSTNLLKKAMEEVNSLVEHVYKKYDAWLTSRKGGGKSIGKSNNRTTPGNDASVIKAIKAKKPGKWTMPDQGCGTGHTASVPVPDDSAALHEKQFDLRGRLIGPKGRNVKRLANASGAKVSVHGHDGQSGMSLELEAGSWQAIEKARELADSLLAEMEKAYECWLLAEEKKLVAEIQELNGEEDDELSAAEAEYEEAKKRRNKKPAGEHVMTIHAFECNKRYFLRHILLGKGGQNVHAIEDLTDTNVSLHHPRGNAPVSVEITASSQSKLLKAKDLVNDLINDKRKDYEKWLKDRERKGKGKGKGGEKKRATEDFDKSQLPWKRRRK